jgi:hypothetical protein
MNKWIKLVPDREQHKTNKAEDCWSYDNSRDDRKFRNDAEAQLWAYTKVINTPLWASIRGPSFTTKPLRVIFDKNLDEDISGCYYGGGLIALHPQHASIFVLTHELVHMAGWDLHDADFRRIHLEIIKNIFNDRIYKSLEMWYNTYIN